MTSSFTRRLFLQSMTVMAAAAATLNPTRLLAAAPAAVPAPAFTLPPLPYAAAALEPAIDTATMEIHHGKHHKAYVDNLNKAVAADPQLQNLSLEALLARAGSLGDAVRNNAGGHWNHSFFWRLMSPVSETSAPSANLLAAINRAFGSLEGFKAALEQAGIARFGSGWVWLIVGDDKKLVVTSTPNQDNPLMDVAVQKGTPLLCNDVWEHAYYLKHQNKRADYLKAWWQVVNWREVSAIYDRTL